LTVKIVYVHYNRLYEVTSQKAVLFGLCTVSTSAQKDHIMGMCLCPYTCQPLLYTNLEPNVINRAHRAKKWVGTTLFKIYIHKINNKISKKYFIGLDSVKIFAEIRLYLPRNENDYRLFFFFFCWRKWLVTYINSKLFS
jgi:hypothetical protein